MSSSLNARRVLISSTTLDLPEHRRQMIAAILRLGMQPLSMEHLSARSADAVQASMQLVDHAEIYVGIFAHRYGHIPKEGNPGRRSITEMEYQRAVARGIPRLIFLMDDHHPILITDVETGAGAAKLARLKKRILQETVVSFFRSPEDLRAHLIESLVPFRQPNISTFHYFGRIPAAPEPYIAHPYTLLHERELVGRVSELAVLSNWARTSRCPVMAIVGLGGMGKSALTWKWFHDAAHQAFPEFAGRLWWSFYESEARFENFVLRCLAYVSGVPLESLQPLGASVREERLLQELDRRPFLVVLDGVERLLRAFAGLHVTRLDLGDEDAREEARRAEETTGSYSDEDPGLLPTRHPSRLAIDPRAGAFLRELTRVGASKILISSRLKPADLVDRHSGGNLPGTSFYELSKLSDAEALDLWRSFHLSGSNEALLEVFRRFDNFPLLICSLAGEVRNYRWAPGNFDLWRRANPEFEPAAAVSVPDVKAHVMKHALQGLDSTSRQVLSLVAGLRTPATYDTLVAILVRSGGLFHNHQELDNVLTDLQDRGLVGWDMRANRYDLHPIVRFGAWAALDSAARGAVHEAVRDHFSRLPTPREPDVQGVEDLTASIELFTALVGLGKYDEACDLLRDRELDEALHRLSAIPLRVQLLEMLFPNGTEQAPRLDGAHRQTLALNNLGRTYVSCGRLERGIQLLRRQVQVGREADSERLQRNGWHDLINALRLRGSLWESEFAAGEALRLSRQLADPFMEGIHLHWLAVTLGTGGRLADARRCLQRTVQLLTQAGDELRASLMRIYFAQLALWEGDPRAAVQIASEVVMIAKKHRIQRVCIRSARLQGMGALALHEQDKAGECLHYALEGARDAHYAEEEVQALVALADLGRLRNDLSCAQERLDEARALAEQSPYPLALVDALNVECRLLLDETTEPSYECIDKAKRAYSLAWCDGPPFAYQSGLNTARDLLSEMGQAPPSLPASDSKSRPALPALETFLRDD